MPKGQYKRVKNKNSPLEVCNVPKIEAGNKRIAISLFQSPTGWVTEVLLINNDKVEKSYSKEPDLKVIAQHDFRRVAALLGTQQIELLEQFFPVDVPESHTASQAATG